MVQKSAADVEIALKMAGIRNTCVSFAVGSLTGMKGIKAQFLRFCAVNVC
jgi:hypothetical protein